MEKIRKHIRVQGFVQGVGFRYRARQAADYVGVTGWVRNDADGAVTMEAQGTEEQIDTMLLMIQKGAFVNIEQLEAKSIPLVEEEYGFEIRESMGDYFGFMNRK
ncbi:MAG: acylphosphatase [Agathobacter sp.]|uniref:acylphosphatase n=1 Tax=Agathobacter sp. TaxID=2021311 RepID=UPI00258AFDD4|nr:acylphosphatase [Agathobacter sp.]MCR5678348.1 acylphosphatase [Agathobacter sp.]